MIHTCSLNATGIDCLREIVFILFIENVLVNTMTIRCSRFWRHFFRSVPAYGWLPETGPLCKKCYEREMRRIYNVMFQPKNAR